MPKMKQPVIYASPLQGFTDYRFRSAFERHFGGIDRYLAPYIRLDGKGEVKSREKRDIDPGNNMAGRTLPQLMVNRAEDFLKVSRFLQEQGYKEVNWNLGCPYPMVTRRGLGSGLLARPDRISDILRQVMQESSIKVSIKMRLGYEDPDEILRLLPALEPFELEHIGIHPRIGKQLYKGHADPERFAACLPLTRHRVFYNGDIDSPEKYQELQDRFPGVNDWMIGRGLIADPFLPSLIRSGNEERPSDWKEHFAAFHQELLDSYSEALSGPKHIIQRMCQFWGYWVRLFPDAGRGIKKLKKAHDLQDYQKAVRDLMITDS